MDSFWRAAGAAALIAAATPALAQAVERPYGPYYGHMMWGDGWGGMLFGLVMMIVFVGVAVAVIVALFRWLGGVGHPHPTTAGRPSAVEILEERFARGEIDAGEFEERRRLLQR